MMDDNIDWFRCEVCRCEFGVKLGARDLDLDLVSFCPCCASEEIEDMEKAPNECQLVEAV